MRFPRPLVGARLVRRYKRFLADAELADGSTVTAHCANSGSMLGVSARTLRDWDQGRREPRGAAKVLLKVAVAAPRTVRKVLAAA